MERKSSVEQLATVTNQSTAQVSSGDRVATPADNLGGTEGAPPTNRAPNNCNPSFFQTLRWGVDSLYLSYPGQLGESVEAELRVLKKQAQDRDDIAAKAQYQLVEHVFEVKDKSSGLFPFTLEDDAFQIRLSAHHAQSMPMAYVKISSSYLSHKAPTEAEAHLRALLRPLGEAQPPKVSRIDLFVDFASSVDMESWSRSAWVTKASGVSQYAQDQTFTGWLIGAGAALMARLYNKQIEIKKSGKTYLEALWREAGWDGTQPVWRLEFQFKREVLDQLSLGGLPQVMGNLNGLWSYVMTEWLKLTIPNYADKTRSRWPIHPLWIALASIDWETQGGPLLREYTPNRAPHEEWVARRALSAVASFAAIKGVTDFDASFDALGDAVFNALDQEAYQLGLSHWDLFKEKVEVLNRRYNTALNTAESAAPKEDPAAREYRRQSDGS